MEQKYAALRDLVESHIGRKLQTPKDFDFLVLQIFKSLSIQMSSYTLKRFWGYLPATHAKHPRVHTLNTLASLVGYKSWEHFEESWDPENTTIESGYAKEEILYTKTLKPGTHIHLTWAPSRQITIKLEGQDLFVVTASTNSKLQVGDTFICPSFVQHEPLHLHCLVQTGGGKPTNYVCGRINGIRFEIV